MRRFFRRALAVALAAALTIPLSGCWDYTEVESHFFVTGIAVDKGTRKRYHLTFEVLDLTKSDSQGSSNTPGKLLMADGDTIADAVTDASKGAANELYFSDCKIVVFSREIAKDGLTASLEWFNRDSEPRFALQLFLSLGDTAGETLEPEEEKGAAVALRLSNEINQCSVLGRNEQVCLYQVDGILLGEGRDLTLPCLKREKAANGKIKTVISGTAVFRGDKLAGYRDEDQTSADRLLSANIQGGTLVVGQSPGENNISLKIRRSQPDLRPVYGKDLSMKASLKMDCSFDEENTALPILRDLGMDDMARSAEECVRLRLQKEIRSVQTELGCDIFGFGSAVAKENPELWKKLKPRWREIFRTLKVDVSADIHLNDSGFAYPKGKQS